MMTLLLINTLHKLLFLFINFKIFYHHEFIQIAHNIGFLLFLFLSRRLISSSILFHSILLLYDNRFPLVISIIIPLISSIYRYWSINQLFFPFLNSIKLFSKTNNFFLIIINIFLLWILLKSFQNFYNFLLSHQAFVSRFHKS